MVAAAAPAALDFESVYAENYDQVFHHVRRLVTHPEVAEDLTGQTFLKAYEAWGRYEERGLPIAAWLIRIARNQVTSYMRSKSSHTALDDSYKDEDETPEEGNTRSPCDSKMQAAFDGLQHEAQFASSIVGVNKVRLSLVSRTISIRSLEQSAPPLERVLLGLSSS